MTTHPDRMLRPGRAATALAASLLAAAAARADTRTWKAATTGDWFAAAN